MSNPGDQISVPIASACADGAYDRRPVYQAIFDHSPEAVVVIPPRVDAVLDEGNELVIQRNRHLLSIQNDGRLKWQRETGYGRRSLVETTMGRYKSLIGPRLRARDFVRQQTEAAVGILVLNQHAGCRSPSFRPRQAAGCLSYWGKGLFKLQQRSAPTPGG